MNNKLFLQFTTTNFVKKTELLPVYKRRWSKHWSRGENTQPTFFAEKKIKKSLKKSVLTSCINYKSLYGPNLWGIGSW